MLGKNMNFKLMIFNNGGNLNYTIVFIRSQIVDAIFGNVQYFFCGCQLFCLSVWLPLFYCVAAFLFVCGKHLFLKPPIFFINHIIDGEFESILTDEGIWDIFRKSKQVSALRFPPFN